MESDPVYLPGLQSGQGCVHLSQIKRSVQLKVTHYLHIRKFVWTANPLQTGKCNKALQCTQMPSWLEDLNLNESYSKIQHGFSLWLGCKDETTQLTSLTVYRLQNDETIRSACSDKKGTGVTAPKKNHTRFQLNQGSNEKSNPSA